MYGVYLIYVAICICFMDGIDGQPLYEDKCHVDEMYRPYNEAYSNICVKNNPCDNGASCGLTPGSYICKCPPGWKGDHCDKDINECEGNPCKNGGTCNNNKGAFTCSCAVGWTGTFCEVVIQTVIVCQDGSMELRCPAGIIKIEKAIWGRTEGASVCYDSRFNTELNCESTTSEAIVKNKCDGYPKCIISVRSETLGGNPCYNTWKYLEVRFTCIVV